MRTLADTWTLAKRSLRHITRSPDTIITVLLMPIALMLLFVYVWGGAMGQQTGSVSYINFIVPGIVVMTVLSGIAYAAVRLNMDVQSGIINRFRTMPVAPSSILGGQVASSTLSNLFSSLVVLLVAFAIGFRSQAGVTGWLVFAGILLLFTLSTTWLAIFFGLLAKTTEGAGAFSYILLLLVFISPSFVPTDSMTPLLRGFAENQPMTPVVETMRSLLVDGTAGPKVWTAMAWILGRSRGLVSSVRGGLQAQSDRGQHLGRVVRPINGAPKRRRRVSWPKSEARTCAGRRPQGRKPLWGGHSSKETLDRAQAACSRRAAQQPRRPSLTFVPPKHPQSACRSSLRTSAEAPSARLPGAAPGGSRP